MKVLAAALAVLPLSAQAQSFKPSMLVMPAVEYDHPYSGQIDDLSGLIEIHWNWRQDRQRR
jgi:hypothetical protein